MIYVRMYETEQQALDTLARLEEDGFPGETIHLLRPLVEGEARTLDEGIAEARRAGFVHGGDGEAYRQCLALGRSLVLVRAAFGFGQDALRILEAGGPVDTHLLPSPSLPAEGDRAAPFSSSLQWTVLKQDSPAPLSAWLCISALSKTSLSDRSFGFPLLSRIATPLSSLLGLKTLSESASTAEASFGLPLLLNEAAPLSSRLGLPVLIGQR